MYKIYKQTLSGLSADGILSIPGFVRALHVDAQNDVPTLWYIYSDEYPVRNVRIKVYCTGQRIHEVHTDAYVGTLLMYQDRLVLHVFVDAEA